MDAYRLEIFKNGRWMVVSHGTRAQMENLAYKKAYEVGLFYICPITEAKNQEVR